MAEDLKIADAPPIQADQVQNDLKLPTGGYGNYSITMITIRDWLVNFKDIVTQTQLLSKADKENTYTKTEVDTKVSTVAGGYLKAFDTLAQLQAATGMTNGQVAKVMNDPNAENNGDYYYNGSNWIKGYDPLNDSKNYTDNLIVNTFDTSESSFELLQPYVDSAFKIAGDIHVAGGNSVAVPNYTYVLNKIISGLKIKAICIQSPLVGSSVNIKVFTKGTDKFTLSRTAYTLKIYKNGLNYFILPADKIITLGENEYIGFSTSYANLNYKLVPSATTPYYYNANSSTATEVPFANAGNTAEIQIGFFSEPKTALVTNQVSDLNDQISKIRSDLYTIDTIGKKGIPDSGTNNANSAQWIPSKPVAISGEISKFSTYSITSGNIEVCVYVKSGTNNFSVKSSQVVPVVSGLNTFSLSIDVEAGEYVGIKTYDVGLTRYVPSSDTSQSFAVYSNTNLDATTGFAGPTDGYIWQYSFEILSKSNGVISTPKWDGLTYTSFGDSITWYNGKSFAPSHKEVGQIAKGYQAYVVDELGCTLDNKGESGWTMPRIFNERVNVYDFSNTYLTTITSGANDQRTGVPVGTLAAIGSTFNTSTYAGAMQAAVEKVINSNPQTKIVLITPIRGWYNEYNTSNVPNTDPTTVGLLKREYPDMVKSIGKLYGLPVVDFYDECELNDLNKNYFLGDNPAVFTAYLLHPTNNFFQRMGEIALSTLRNL